jgi:integrase
MIYSFARIGAVVGMKGDDYYQNGKRWWLRFHEKGEKFHEVPAHHNAAANLNAYLEAAGISLARKMPLFRSADAKRGKLTRSSLWRNSAFDMVKRRSVAAGMPENRALTTFGPAGSPPISKPPAPSTRPSGSPPMNRPGRPSFAIAPMTRSRSTS